VSLDDGVRGERNNENCAGFGLLVRMRLNSGSAGIQDSRGTGQGEVSGSSRVEEEEKRHRLTGLYLLGQDRSARTEKGAGQAWVRERKWPKKV
jgi:hypothetical protein